MTAPATPPEGLGIPLTHNAPGFAVDAIYSKNDGSVYALVNGVEIPLTGGGGPLFQGVFQFGTPSNGVISFAGFGFQPRSVIAFSLNPAGGLPQLSIGVAVAPVAPQSQFTCFTPSGTGVVGLWSFSFNNIVQHLDLAGAWLQEAEVISYDADGITIQTSTSGVVPAFTIQVNLIAFG